MEGLHIFGLSHYYDAHKVLDNASLMIPSGELVCMLGPSGSGKSTLLRLASGLEKVQEGTIVIDDVIVGTPRLHLHPEHRKVGVMFQDYTLFPHLTIIKNILFGLFNLPTDKAYKRAMNMLDQVGMTSHADKYPHMLSGGQQQRIALARALAPEPSLLLLDEPLSGVEESRKKIILSFIKKLSLKNKIPILYVTHNNDEVKTLTNKVFQIKDGMLKKLEKEGD